jgi:hypothetical protein
MAQPDAVNAERHRIATERGREAMGWRLSSFSYFEPCQI